ncbi:aminotransferase [Desulforhopalus singaporensis]|uniref:Adenosylmethionine-8-amino-7-oxononanoate aminotransferase n=1 Tax=Desulforhopalus singaporensis TaxID=91360 RepID=A0A1H0LJA4_9BACT|nr:aminotransferase [Desulforhopalus singaporensis]SDO68254.1 Adenosylmethionine-8-amino-7-oxononanoate aminotransferase [Desulforhopalus singaporensis]
MNTIIDSCFDKINEQGTQVFRKKDNQFYLHPWEDLGSFGGNDRTVAVGGEGIYLFDSEGNKLIDGPGGMWCTQIGYGREEMADAIAGQVMRSPYYSPFNLTSDISVLLAEKLARLTPGDLNTVFFTTGGSTAVDSALRLVAFYNNCKGRPNKKRIISRKDAYHGSTYLSASASGKTRDKNYQDFATDIISFIDSPNPFRKPRAMSVEEFRDLKVKELEDKILELGPDNVAAFIAEPVMASGGVVVPPVGYHRMCLDVCRKYDVLYISDEVVTGFGRLGHWFASEEVFDIIPDIITCAKGLTSGYLPLGACIVSDKLMAEMGGEQAKGVIFSNGYTYSGHPVACAAALKNIEIMERENILEHVREIEPYFLSKVKELEDIPIVGNVRGQGLMACVECLLNPEEESPLELDYEMGSRIDSQCQAMGLIVRPVINMNVMSPPLIITREQIDEMFKILRRGIEKAMDELIRDGLWEMPN